MHKVIFKSDENGRTRLFVDGIDMSRSCRRVVIKQDGGEFPEITLTLGCANVEVSAESVEVRTEN